MVSVCVIAALMLFLILEPSSLWWSKPVKEVCKYENGALYWNGKIDQIMIKHRYQTREKIVLKTLLLPGFWWLPRFL